MKWLLHSRQFSISFRQLGKYAPPNMAVANLSRPKKYMAKKLNVEIERLKKAQSKDSAEKVKNPVLHYSDRTKVFNQKLMRSVGIVMSQMPSLVGRGLSISKVNTTKDFTEVRVFWISSKEWALEELTDILEKHTGDIRHRLTNTAGLGAIPKISFHLDKHFLYDNVIEQLMENADKGPPDVNVDENIHCKNFHDIVLKKNMLGLNRSRILDSIEASVKRGEAKLHEVDKDQVECFMQVYRQGIAGTGNDKKERENKIKTFLSQRRKDEQKE